MAHVVAAVSKGLGTILQGVRRFVLLGIAAMAVSYAHQANTPHRVRGVVRTMFAFAGALAAAGGLIKPTHANTFIATDTGITFSYSAEQLGLEVSPKLVKTHSSEVFLKSSKIKGLSVGVTVDPVKISNIKEFETPLGLAERVVKVEKSKEGVFEANVISASESKTPVSEADPSIPSYEIEYNIDSSRGKNHYLVKTAVVESKLYVFTAQCKEDTFPELKASLSEILNTFSIEKK
jgi:hypothetical protein